MSPVQRLITPLPIASAFTKATYSTRALAYSLQGLTQGRLRSLQVCAAATPQSRLRSTRAQGFDARGVSREYSATTMALTRSTDPLVWIDCEMTGLAPPPNGKDTILSLSCLLTDHRLTLLDPTGFDAVVHHSRQQLDSMSPWCITTHGNSGLTQACLSSTTTADVAAEDLLAYIETHIPKKGVALLAGNSIHADKSFLMQKPWNVVLEHLHYRLFDVSAMKEMVRRWCSEEVLRGVPVKELRHEARGDVEESIEEGRYYMKLLENIKGPS